MGTVRSERSGDGCYSLDLFFQKDSGEDCLLETSPAQIFPERALNDQAGFRVLDNQFLMHVRSESALNNASGSVVNLKIKVGGRKKETLILGYY